ncbi:HsdM family class I SAM-dependent methyltransferase [Bacillus thermotolerans]|uniref:HsdM family class I SAM-dependent methyltransferase n=1 Tax=Bacillus thermotolerans TaxID=1221996 RepID=UPI00057F832B|nr:N-6 DNA methylase [Bacillus thermotolerans]KKB33481.1 Type I restriction-modification system, DNA-methyltransferase subunit M [Bacillus thermotolerans]
MKNEASTDLWVYDLLKEANLGKVMSPQGSNIKEINEALKTASKSGTGNVGRPEYVGVVHDFVIVIENKSSVSKHIDKSNDGLIVRETSSIRDYAVNGALYYAKHIARNTNFKKIFAIGVSGNEKRHIISPIFVDERGGHKELPEIETFISFSHKNIQEYYIKEVLEEDTDKEKELAMILKDAQELHEDLRNYGAIQDKDKPLIVSGILLALRETEYGGFSIDSLTGDTTVTDGQKIYSAIENNLQRSNVSPTVKKDKLMSQFDIIKNTVQINEINKSLGKTPLKYYTEFLYNRVYTNIVYSKSSEDILGRFYGEFMSYSGGDGQTLGIVLTPRHITDLFCDLLELSPNDKVLDPACGTGGFLVAAMHHMLEQTEEDDVSKRNSIKKDQIYGIEIQNYMFTIATTNMILRGDGKSNLENADFLRLNPSEIQLQGCTVGMLNPPYSQGSSKNPDLYEMSFTEHLLDSLVEGGRVAVIVPQSSMTGKTNVEKEIKRNILKKHTLEGVITLNKDTFYNFGVNPCIAVFTTGIPHDKNKTCKFINFTDDGYKVSKHVGLVETPQAKDKKQYLLDVWFDRIEANNDFCVKTKIESDDEWLHSFYYFNDEIPEIADFEKTISDYLSFELNMVLHNREYLFENGDKYNVKE